MLKFIFNFVFLIFFMTKKNLKVKRNRFKNLWNVVLFNLKFAIVNHHLITPLSLTACL